MAFKATVDNVQVQGTPWLSTENMIAAGLLSNRFQETDSLEMPAEAIDLAILNAKVNPGPTSELNATNVILPNMSKRTGAQR